MTGSTVPRTLDALFDLWADAVPNLTVGEGTLLDADSDLLIVGYSESDDDEAVSGYRDRGDYGDSQDVESYDIACLLSVWIGDADTRGMRSKLFAYLDELDAALKVAPDLGVPGVMSVRMTEFSLRQPITGQGSTATMPFAVHVEAFRA